MDHMMTEERPFEDGRTGRKKHAILLTIGAVLALGAVAGVLIVGRQSNGAALQALGRDTVTVTLDGAPLDAAVVGGSIKREEAGNPQVAGSARLLATRGAASAALEELLVRRGREIAQVTPAQVDQEIKQADSIFAVGGTPPKNWTDADRAGALKDPKVRQAVERMLYRGAGLSSVLSVLPAEERSAAAGNEVLGKWFGGQLNDVKVVVKLSDGTILSNRELVLAVAPVPVVESTPATIPGSEAPTTSTPSSTVGSGQ